MKKEITHLYGVIGRPLVHSYSPELAKEKFAEKKLSGHDYGRFELQDISELMPLINDKTNLKGLNVTIPYKKDVMEFLDEIDPNAEAIGAVNCVKITRGNDGKPHLKGYNTDWYGFTKSLEPMLRPTHKKALILGTGGASQAIKYALNKLGLETRFVSRTPADGQFSYSDLTPEVMTEYTVIVNTTPVGMFPNTKACPQIPYECLTSNHIAYDVIYNPIKTLFLTQAETKGAQIKNGWEMFVHQALRSYQIWEGGEWSHRF